MKRCSSLAVLLCVLVATLYAAPHSALQLAKDFRKGNLGLFDVSSDGSLLLLRDPVKTSRKLENSRTSFKVRAIAVPGYRELASVAIEFSENISTPAYSGSRQSFFLPNSHKVVLIGRLAKSQDAPALMLWSPETGQVERFPNVVGEASFLVDAWDDDQVIYYTVDPADSFLSQRRGRRFFLYRLSTRDTKTIDIKDDEFRYDGEAQVVISPDRKNIVALIEGGSNKLEIRDLDRSSTWSLAVPSGKIVNFAYSPDGKYLAVISVRTEVVPGTEGGTTDESDVPFISIYDTFTKVRIRSVRILDHVKPYARKVYKLAAAEDYLAATGEQMRFSLDSKMLAITFAVGSVNAGRQAAHVALFEFPSLEAAGMAEHPSVKIGVWRFIGFSAVGGRLRFSPDGKLLFTTSKYAVAWNISSFGQTNPQ